MTAVDSVIIVIDKDVVEGRKDPVRVMGGKKDDLFTAGLLHDIGVLVARRYLPEESREAERRVVEEGLSPLEAERRVIGARNNFV